MLSGSLLLAVAQKLSGHPGGKLYGRTRSQLCWGDPQVRIGTLWGGRTGFLTVLSLRQDMEPEHGPASTQP